MSDWRYVGGPVGLREILDTRSEALPDVDAFAEEWVARVSSQPGRALQRDERAVLFELASWSHGPDGVGALARRRRQDLPELFVAWVDALVAAGREDDAATACTEALGSVPALGEVRAEIAERYAPLADAPGHPASCASIAWRAAPTAACLRRLAACGDDAAITAEADAVADTRRRRAWRPRCSCSRDGSTRHVALRSALEGAVRRSPRLAPLPSRRR